MSLMDVDTDPPMDGPDASDGDGADASDAGEPRLLESSHRAISDGLGGFEGQTPDALPEKILGTVEWNHFDLDPDNSPVIKVCGEDN